MNQIGHFKVLGEYVLGGICPRGYVSYGVSVQRVSVHGVSDQGVCVLGVSVWGVHVQGVLSCHHCGLVVFIWQYSLLVNPLQ